MPGRDRPQRRGQDHHHPHGLGLATPDAGEVAYTLDGTRRTMPQDALAIKARLGVVSQFDTLDPDFTWPRTCWSMAAISA
jgi:hypothetical protein